jgi:Domain of unknown function (DUF4411)
VSYSFDTSSWLNGRRDLMRPNVFRTLWSNIEGLIAEGAIRSVDLVKDELSRREDEIYQWSLAQAGLFVPITTPVQQATRDILGIFPRLVGVGSGRSGADPFVIAMALAQDAAVVSEETRTGRPDRPRIPDVCDGMGVRCLTLMQFVEEQGWIF